MYEVNDFPWMEQEYECLLKEIQQNEQEIKQWKKKASEFEKDKIKALKILGKAQS